MNVLLEMPVMPSPWWTRPLMYLLYLVALLGSVLVWRSINPGQ